MLIGGLHFKVVGTNSLVGSALIYTAVALQASRFRILTQGPFPIPPPLSPTLLPVSSDPFHHNKGENSKKKKKKKKL